MSDLQSSRQARPRLRIAETVRRVDPAALAAELLEHPHSTMEELAESWGMEVIPALVADVRVSGDRVYVSRKARGKRLQWLIAQGITHWALLQLGDIQTSADPIAAMLAPDAAKAVGHVS